MNRRYFNDGQELVLEDLNGITQAIERGIYDNLIYQIVQRVEDAFFGDSFLVSFASATSITVKKGLGFQTDLAQVSPEPTRRPLFLSADSNPSISTPDGADDRIDVVSVKAEFIDELSQSRKFKDAIDSEISTVTMVIQRQWAATITITAGTPNAVPVAPATPVGEIKIAELYVTAVTGLSGAGAVTDFRDLLPVGGDVLVNTTGYNRLTAGLATPLSTLMAEIDEFILHGNAEYIDFEDLGADPAAPLAASNKQRLYFKGGVAFFRSQAPGGAITPLGSGGGGGGGLIWQEPAGAPIKSPEFDQDVYFFTQGGENAESLTVFLKVPESYVAGRQIFAFLGAYSASSANQFRMQVLSTLIREDQDAVNSVTNQNTANSGDFTNTVANQYRGLEIGLTDSLGRINSISVSPGDLIKMALTRQAPGGTDDTADIRFIPTSTEVKFG